MSNVKTFLELLKKSNTEDLNTRSNIDEDSISIDLLTGLNNHKNVYGKASEYKRMLNTCKFKLCAYYTFDKWNKPYTVNEKINKLHRRYIPSIDTINKRYNEEQALNVLIDYCLRKYDRLDAAQIYYIDRVNNLEHLIFKFNAANVMLSENVQIEFQTNEQTNSTYFKRFIDSPIRTENLKY